VISSLQIFDVYAKLDFAPRNDTVNGKAPASAVWHDGNNTLGGTNTPYYVAKDRGPKYLNSAHGGYQVIQPLVTPTQSGGNFTLSTITMQKTNATGAAKTYPSHAAFEVLDGMLSVTLAAQTVDLLQGDVVFIPGNTRFTYSSKAAFTKFLAVGQGNFGLATDLINGGKSWDSPVWPIA
jgi:quercetin dioxygenase-like cupin family protein